MMGPGVAPVRRPLAATGASQFLSNGRTEEGHSETFQTARSGAGLKGLETPARGSARWRCPGVGTGQEVLRPGGAPEPLAPLQGAGRWRAVAQGSARLSPGLRSVAPPGPGENSLGLEFDRPRHVQRGLFLHRQPPLCQKLRCAPRRLPCSLALAALMPEMLREISIITNAQAEEAVVGLLDQTFGQSPAVHLDVASGMVTASVYSELPAAEVHSTRALLRTGLRDIITSGLDPSPGQVRIRMVPPRNWSESWKRHFRPMEFGPDLLVKPTWSQRRPRPGQALVLLDPGLSFGTGQHATTRYCLEQLVSLRRSRTVPSLLDAGTGSGILAIAAAQLGYAPVQAFDFDPEAVRIARENCVLNNVQLTLGQADLTRLPRSSRERFDVICANLIHDLLIAERDRLLARLKPGGTLVVAGILKTQFAEVERAFRAAGLRLLRARTGQEWRSGTFRWTPPTAPPRAG